MKIKVFIIHGEIVALPALALETEVEEWLRRVEGWSGQKKTINVISTALTTKGEELIYTVIYEYEYKYD